MRPGIDDLVIAFGIGNETHVIVFGNLAYLFVTTGHQFHLFLRDDDVVKVERQTGHVCHTVTQVLDTIKEFASLGETNGLDHIGNDVAQTLLGDNLVHITYLIGDDAIDNDTSHRSLHHTLHIVALLIHILHYHLYLGMKVTFALIVGNDGLFGTVEGESLTLCSGANLGDIVETEHHIL